MRPTLDRLHFWTPTFGRRSPVCSGHEDAKTIVTARFRRPAVELMVAVMDEILPAYNAVRDLPRVIRPACWVAEHDRIVIALAPVERLR
jgi:hypothetical protein